MRVGIASDHAGFELKEFLKGHMENIDWIDFGCDSKESVDYPDFVPELCRELLGQKLDFGVLLCGTGIGVSMTANRFQGIRSAICHNRFTAEMSRKHNDANVLAMGARVLSKEEAADLLDVFLSTSYEGGRHQRRVEKIDRVSQTRQH